MKTNDKSHDREKLIILLDLDGTLTNPVINNTYTFIKLFYRFNRSLTKLQFLNILIRATRVLEKLLTKAKLSSIVSVDGILITILFFGTNRQKLKYFALLWTYILLKLYQYNEILLFIKYLLKLNSIKVIMLTACTEEPACTISKLLGFHHCIARKFVALGNLIITVKDLANIATYKYSRFVELLNTMLKESNTANRRTYNIYIADIDSIRAELNFISRGISEGILDLVLLYDRKLGINKLYASKDDEIFQYIKDLYKLTIKNGKIEKGIC